MANDELIRKQDALDTVEKVGWYHINRNGELVTGANSREDEPLYKAKDIYEALENVKPVQPKRGKWEYHSNPTIGINPETAYCSCCGLRVDTTGDIDFDEYNFCPRCGADMRGNENGRND